jgi:outer membrane immunogenic protein
MKKVAFLTTAVAISALCCGTASAADLPARAPAPAPAPVMAYVYDWTGFYIGANGGWASSRNCWGFIPVAGAAVIADGCSSKSGGVFGGQVGYRWQAGQFVFGLEAQGDWSNINSPQLSVWNPALTTGTKVNGLGLFTGQIGYAANAALFYLKGGAAMTSSSAYINTTFGNVGLYSASATRWGGVLGVGFEYGFSPNWTAGIEYDRLMMGSANNSFSVAIPQVAAAANRISQDVDMLTLRLNYKFGGAVVAKY